MSTTGLMITLDDLVIEFASNMNLGMKAIAAAAETYHTALVKYPTRAEKFFADKFPTIRKDTWRILDEIGGRKLPPQAMMMAPGALEKLREAKIPQKTMLTLATSRVSVYDPGTGKYHDIPFAQLTERQADIVLNPKTHAIRTEMQQVRYCKTAVAEAAAAHACVKDAPCYVIIDGDVLFKKTARMSAAELHRILEELEGGNAGK